MKYYLEWFCKGGVGRHGQWKRISGPFKKSRSAFEKKDKRVRAQMVNKYGTHYRKRGRRAIEKTYRVIGEEVLCGD